MNACIYGPRRADGCLGNEWTSAEARGLFYRCSPQSPPLLQHSHDVRISLLTYACMHSSQTHLTNFAVLAGITPPTTAAPMSTTSFTLHANFDEVLGNPTDEAKVVALTQLIFDEVAAAGIPTKDLTISYSSGSIVAVFRGPTSIIEQVSQEVTRRCCMLRFPLRPPANSCYITAASNCSISP